VKVVCPACRADVHLPDDRATRDLRCRSCGGRPELLVPARESPADDRSDPRIEERWDGAAVAFVVRPQRWAALPLVFFTVVWNVFLVGWFRLAFDAPGPLGLALWAPLVHLAIGAVVAYEALQGLVGRVVLTLDRAHLGARREPLPGPGRVAMATAEIERFDAAVRAAPAWACRPEADRRHAVRVACRDGEMRWLPVSFSDEAQAVRLAARLDASLRALRTPRGYRG